MQKLETGKVYVLNRNAAPWSSTYYRLVRFEELGLMGYFWYKNKFGEGYCTKDYNVMLGMTEAPQAIQVLYGT